MHRNTSCGTPHVDGVVVSMDVGVEVNEDLGDSDIDTIFGKLSIESFKFLLEDDS